MGNDKKPISRDRHELTLNIVANLNWFENLSVFLSKKLILSCLHWSQNILYVFQEYGVGLTTRLLKHWAFHRSE